MPYPYDPGDMGIRIADLFAGFAGGVVNAFFFQRGKPFDAAASVVGGALTANFLTGSFAAGLEKVVGLAIERGGAGFIVGLTAMVICQGVTAALRLKFGKKEDRYDGTNPKS